MSLILQNTELKTCPFCGDKPMFTKDVLPNGMWLHKIFCDNCNFSLKTVRGETQLIEQWNTRFN